MAVSILERPLGHIFDPDSSISVESITNSSGDALVTDTSHGLSDGDYVYIKSPIEAYCGFWYVDEISANTFKIKKHATADPVTYVRDASTTTVYYVVTESHNWSCVHLPIVYKLSNTLWPVNSEDTVRVISNCTDSNGYCLLTLSGDIKTTGSAAALEYIKITDSSEFSGVWQIISYSSDTSIVVDIPFSAANALLLVSANAQYYYNNYHVKVEVHGGLNNGHVYYAQEPYDLLATLDLIPDENNEVKFSIHEILQKNIEVKNNLLLSTLPNNLDAFTMFFIKYAEVYDNSDGTTLSATTPSYTSDINNFEGFAINAKLPFKNIYSGSMSEYVSGDVDQKFLTAFETPVIFSGKYFDLSFITELTTTKRLRQQYYLNSVLQSTVTTTIDQSDEGVYRVKITESCVYDRVDITILNVTSDPITEVKTITINCDCIRSKATGYYLSWLNHLGGFDYWHFTGYAEEITEILDSGETEENDFPDWPNSGGEFADTKRKNTYRDARDQVLVRSQHLTTGQVEAIKRIKTSPLVQVVNSIYDRRTVIVDTDSFTSLKEGNNLHEISFTITYTDDVPSQTV